jgi:hypothetical protein
MIFPVTLPITLPQPPGFKLGGETVGGVINQIVPVILTFAGFVLLIMLMISGYQLMVSRGDPKALEGAKGRLIFALIGFLIIFGAYWILVIIQDLFKLGVAQPQ